MDFRYFDDFEAGETVEYGRYTISKDELIAFANVYDPQPMHIDEEAARHTLVKTLIASGWHTISINMRMFADAMMAHCASMGAPAIHSMKWLKPVKPGDTLTARYTIMDVKKSVSKPDRGVLMMKIECLNQQRDIVMEQINPIMLMRRDSSYVRHEIGQVTTEPYGLDDDVQTGFSPCEATQDGHLDAFDDLELGRVTELGSAHFKAKDIIRFGRSFDPQPFHISEDAGKRSHFGGLVACGWQTAGAWMRLMIENRNRRAAMMIAAGKTPAVLGPSPGFTDLRWLKPVYAGDTIKYRSTLLEKRLLKSRPGWGMVSHLNQGFNETGETVFEFKGNVLWQHAPDVGSIAESLRKN